MIYPKNLESCPPDGFKAPKIDSREEGCISQYYPSSQESIFGSFQSRLEGNFRGFLGLTYSAEETHRAGKMLGEALPAGSIVALYGDLGAGKTTFIRGLAEGAGAIDPRIVSSPTFTFLNIYQGDKVIYHFDLYRLKEKEEFFAAGFDEYFTAGGICCVEWAEKMGSELPAGVVRVNLSHYGAEKRQIEIL